MSLFSRPRRQSTTFSKGRNVASMNHGIGQDGQSIVSRPLCRGNILMLKRRWISSSRIIKRCSAGCQEYWDNVRQASLSSSRPTHYLTESRDCVEHGWDVLSIKEETIPIRRRG